MEIEDWNFKEGAEPQTSNDGFWYDLTDGGYIKPEEVLADGEQLEKLRAAIDIVQSFEAALSDNDLLEEN